MITYLHFPNGTTVLKDNDYSGYEPDRHDRVNTIHIDDGEYQYYICPHYVLVKYKYMTVIYNQCFKIGKWRYSIDHITTYKGSESKHLIDMNAALIALVEHRTINGERLLDRRTTNVLLTHDESLESDTGAYSIRWA